MRPISSCLGPVSVTMGYLAESAKIRSFNCLFIMLASIYLYKSTIKSKICKSE